MTLHASTVARGFICIAACWLALARAEYVDPAVRLLAPLENEKLPDSNIPFHFRKEHDPSVSFSVVVFLDGHQIHKSQENEEALQISQIQPGYHMVELQLVDDEAGEIVGYDGVEVFVLGGGTLAPSGLDSDAEDTFAHDTAAINAVLLRAQEKQTRQDFAAAISDYSALIASLNQVPTDATPRAYIALGKCLLAAKRHEAALSAFRDAVWHTVSSAEAHAYIAAVLRTTYNSYPPTLSRGDESSLIQRHWSTARRLDPTILWPEVPSDPTAPTPLKVGLLTVGSGRYARFFKNNTLSAENYLLREVAEMHYFVFTDNIKAIEEEMVGTEVWEQGRVHVTFRVHDGWPSASMKRAHTYLEHADVWQAMDYVFAVDVDVRFVSYTGREILGATVGTLHADNARYTGSEVVGQHHYALPNTAPPGTMWRQHQGSAALLTGAVYERRDASVAAMREGEGRQYYAGGFYGGTSPEVVKLLQALVRNTDEDIDKGLIAIFHDESQINRYWFLHPPEVTLSCAYLYPEPTPEPCWSRDSDRTTCVRDEGHPWLWTPWRPSQLDGEGGSWTQERWSSHRKMPIRCLNLSKDKQALLA